MGKFPMICLNCGEPFMSYKPRSELSKPRQCFRCWSTDVIPKADIEEMTYQVYSKVKSGESIVPLDVLDVIQDYTKKKGYRFHLVGAFRLVKEVWEGALKRLREEGR